mmetsp:Transcript_48179/g.94126  ORF Transcript_48179/g.94126 Transcript_48179/m.94126 type:complete len:237 (-) Transcript_48179:396-1106(-)
MGSSADRVCFCVLVVLVLLHLLQVKRLAFNRSPLIPHISLILSSFALSQSSRRLSFCLSIVFFFSATHSSVWSSSDDMRMRPSGVIDPSNRLPRRVPFFRRLNTSCRDLDAIAPRSSLRRSSAASIAAAQVWYCSTAPSLPLLSRKRISKSFTRTFRRMGARLFHASGTCWDAERCAGETTFFVAAAVEEEPPRGERCEPALACEFFRETPRSGSGLFDTPSRLAISFHFRTRALA